MGGKKADPGRLCQALNAATAKYLAAGRDETILWFEMHPLLERFAYQVAKNMLAQRGTFRRPDEIGAMAEEIADFIVRRYLRDEHFMIKLYGPYIRLRVLSCLGSSVPTLYFSEIADDYDGSELAAQPAGFTAKPDDHAKRSPDRYLSQKARRKIRDEEVRRVEALRKVGGRAPSSGAIWNGYPPVVASQSGNDEVEPAIPSGVHWKQGELGFALCS